MLSPKGLAEEAECMLKVVRAERNVQAAEQKLAKCHIKESILRTRLYRVQDAMAKRLIQLSESEIGRAWVEVQHISNRHICPQILETYKSNSIRA